VQPWPPDLAAAVDSGAGRAFYARQIANQGILRVFPEFLEVIREAGTGVAYVEQSAT
jgi:hypothetical protein